MDRHSPDWYRKRRWTRTKAGRCERCGRPAAPFKTCKVCRLLRHKRRNHGIRHWQRYDVRSLPLIVRQAIKRFESITEGVFRSNPPSSYVAETGYKARKHRSPNKGTQDRRVPK